jgi:hypothetical protein
MFILATDKSGDLAVLNTDFIHSIMVSNCPDKFTIVEYTDGTKFSLQDTVIDIYKKIEK